MSTPNEPTPPTPASARPEPKPPTPEQIRIRALERENRWLRDQVHMLERTLRTIDPERFISEEQWEEEIAHAVPAEVLMAEVEKRVEVRDAAA